MRFRCRSRSRERAVFRFAKNHDIEPRDAVFLTACRRTNAALGEDEMSVRKSTISRRALLKAGAALSVLPAPYAFAQSSEPLKIGFLTVLTGPLAAGGKQQEEGSALFRKERTGVIGGRKVELITQDTAVNPALAKTKLQELVERSKVQVTI